MSVGKDSDNEIPSYSTGFKLVNSIQTRPEVSEADPSNQKVTRSKVSNFSKEVTN